MESLTDPILEEYVQYRIFPDHMDMLKAQKIYKGDPRDFTSAYLYSLKLSILNSAPPLINKYLWHDESFNLTVSTEREPHLYGRLVYGDGLEDEWFVTFILLEVSKKLPGLIISLSDSDGEFLLIEAAEHLPSWLEPETSENRIFIHQGNLCIISLEDLPQQPTLAESLQFLSKNPFNTIASKSIQSTIEDKVKGYREGVQKVHRARVLVPKKLGATLSTCPRLVSSIIKAFVTESLNISKASKFSHLRKSGGDLELCSMRLAFTRTQFAQLVCQKIFPPREYPLQVDETSPDFLAYSLGLKLAIGAELLLSKLESSPSLEEGRRRPSETNVSLDFLQLAKDYFRLSQFKEDPPSPTIDFLLKDTLDYLVEEYFGPDDDLAWLDLQEGPIMNDISSKLDGVRLTEKDSEEIFQKMMDEEENPSNTTGRLLQFMKASSGLDGIYYDPTEHPDDNDDISTEEDDNNNVGLENDDELVEHEIMEALLYDPDLLMKLLEKGSSLGIDCKELLLKLNSKSQKVNPNRPLPPITMRQKGLADIDSIKLAGLVNNIPPSSQIPQSGIVEKTDCLASNSSERNDDDFKVDQDFEDDNKEISHSNEGADPKLSSIPPLAIEYSDSTPDSEKDQDIDIDDYLEIMDEQLLATAVDRDISASFSRNINEAVNVDKSPAHALFLSIIK